MSSEIDHQAEATAAMALAAAATTDPERSRWVRVAVAWQDLARHRQANEAITTGHRPKSEARRA